MYLRYLALEYLKGDSAENARGRCNYYLKNS